MDGFRRAEVPIRWVLGGWGGGGGCAGESFFPFLSLSLLRLRVGGDDEEESQGRHSGDKERTERRRIDVERNGKEKESR